MPINILSPEQSFVQFNQVEPACNNINEPCLPVVGKFDISFQFIVDDDTPITQTLQGAIAGSNCQLIEGIDLGAGIITTICNKRVIVLPEADFFLHQIKFNGVTKVYDLDNVTSAQLMAFLETDFDAVLIGDNAILECCNNELIIDVNKAGSFSDDFSDDFDNGGAQTLDNFKAWYYGYFNIVNVPITVLKLYDCFKYAIVANDEIVACSNCFKVSNDLCFTTFLTYQNVEDAFGFLYAQNIFNKIRLPFYLRAPLNPSVKKVYRRSDAQYKTTSAVYDRKYSLLTDWMPDWFHEKLSIALGHDYVKMENDLFSVNAEVLVDSYAPEWQEDDFLLLAQAKATVTHTRYNYKNDSCGPNGCSDYVPPGEAPCVPIAIPGTPTLPDGVIGEDYNSGFVLTGSQPFAISIPDLVKPAWMNVYVDVDSIRCTGTPTPGSEGDEIPISIKVTNACGNVTFNDTISVAPAAAGARFTDTTFVSDDSLNVSEIANIIGVAGTTVTVTLDTLTNSNGGVLKVNGSPAFAGNTWDVVLDGSGNGSLNVAIEGVVHSPSVIIGHFTITAVSAGGIGVPNAYQISKVF